jgi:putative isomerase
VERYLPLLKSYILENCEKMTREPKGILKYPYITPSSQDSPFYSDNLWDWDSWFASVALGQAEMDSGQKDHFFIYEAGCIKNFLDHTASDGVMPIQLNPKGSLDSELSRSDGDKKAAYSQNMHKPVLAQHAALIIQKTGKVEWLIPHMDKIKLFLNRYLESHVHKETSLAYWQTDFAVGVDNDPSVFYRPDKSCGSIYLNCLLYRELLAYGYLLEMQGKIDEAIQWRGKADDLARAINAYCWDERDEAFYSVDFALRSINPSDWLHKGAPRAWNCLLLRIDNWSSFLPLWAGFASHEQAKRLVKRYHDDRTFRCNYGIRSLSRLEKMYNLRASNNPSNWLGPVWGISNYLMFRGLQKYGFTEDAQEIAEKTVRLFGKDLENSGSLHEFYHPDNGEPIMTKDFQNWNFLVLNMIAWLEHRPEFTEF